MAEAKRDYYEVLGVSRDADDATLKKAYRALAKKYRQENVFFFHSASPSLLRFHQLILHLVYHYALLHSRKSRQAFH